MRTEYTVSLPRGLDFHAEVESDFAGPYAVRCHAYDRHSGPDRNRPIYVPDADVAEAARLLASLPHGRRPGGAEAWWYESEEEAVVALGRTVYEARRATYAR